MSICQQLKHLHLFQMECRGRACLQRQTYGWDTDTHDIKTFRAMNCPELSIFISIRMFSTLNQSSNTITSLINEQHDSQVSRLQRDPRRETAIISSIKILRTQMNSQEFTHLSMFHRIKGE